MNVDAIALHFQGRLVTSVMLWTMHRLTLQLMPVITAYMERGWGAAVSMVAALVVQSVRTRTHPASSALFAESVSWPLNRLVKRRPIIEPVQHRTYRVRSRLSSGLCSSSRSRVDRHPFKTCLEVLVIDPHPHFASLCKGNSGRTCTLVYTPSC